VTLAVAKDIVYTHHERWDGSGYPQGLRGTNIPIAGRVVALVDVYDAVVTDRPYRKAMSHDEVVVLIVSGSGTHFDPDVVAAFTRLAPAFRRLSEEGMA
jgi:putative two-component system response regulator